MSDRTGIEWTDATWNPVTGCSKISPGCKHCYAELMSARLRDMGSPKYEHGFQVTLHEQALSIPARWTKPRMVFVNSMSDLFHEKVPERFIQRTFEAMRQSPQHTFQVLTKRSERLMEMAPWLDWPSNVWVGVSVESEGYLGRIENLRSVPARTRFVSFEPLLGPVGQLDLNGIHWAIVGGESGPSARPLGEEWVTEIRDQCVAVGVPFFFKQWGGKNKKAAGRVLQGRTWSETPVPAHLPQI